MTAPRLLFVREGEILRVVSEVAEGRLSCRGQGAAQLIIIGECLEHTVICFLLKSGVEKCFRVAEKLVLSFIELADKCEEVLA